MRLLIVVLALMLAPVAWADEFTAEVTYGLSPVPRGYGNVRSITPLMEYDFIRYRGESIMLIHIPEGWEYVETVMAGCGYTGDRSSGCLFREYIIIRRVKIKEVRP